MSVVKTCEERPKVSQLVPFGRKGCAFAIFLPAVLCFVTTIGLGVCNNIEGCGEGAWRKDIWVEVNVGTDFCDENVVGAFLTEQVNSLTNFAYFFVGLVAIFLSILDKIALKRKGAYTDMYLVPRNNLTLSPHLSLIFGFVLLYVGSASFIYHANGGVFVQLQDQASIFAVVLYVLVLITMMYVPVRSKRKTKVKVIALVLWAVVCGIIIFALHTVDLGDRLIFILQLAIIGVDILLITLEFLVRFLIEKRTPGWLRFITGFFAGAFLLGALYFEEEFFKFNCDPDSLLQFHSIWHLLTALGLLTLYFFFRADHSVPEEKNTARNSRYSVSDVNAGGDVEALL